MAGRRVEARVIKRCLANPGMRHRWCPDEQGEEDGDQSDAKIQACPIVRVFHAGSPFFFGQLVRFQILLCEGLWPMRHLQRSQPPKTQHQDADPGKAQDQPGDVFDQVFGRGAVV